MALHLTVFRTRYPLYKYAVVAAVTIGVAVFTLHHPSAKKKGQNGNGGNNSLWGLLLLAINLLFDGLTNSTQDYIFQTFQPYSGPQMMCAQNILNTLLTASYLILSPYLATTAIGSWLGMPGDGANEFRDALAFIGRHPGVGWDVLGFAACGAVGQVFICKASLHYEELALWLSLQRAKSPSSISLPPMISRQHALHLTHKKFSSTDYKSLPPSFLSSTPTYHQSIH
jgi:solute carrier family 35 (UDP-galactose transporter), member B1